MSLQLQQFQSTDCQMRDGDGFRKYNGVVSFLPPPPPAFGVFGSSGEREYKSRETGFQEETKGWSFQSFKGNDDGCEGLGNGRNEMEEEVVEEGESFVVAGKEHDSNGQHQSKLCARGHWRPAEDAKHAFH